MLFLGSFLVERGLVLAGPTCWVRREVRNLEWCGIEASKSTVGLDAYAHVLGKNGALNLRKRLSPPYLDVFESLNNFLIVYEICAFIAHAEGCHEVYLVLMTQGQNIERHVTLLWLVKPPVPLFCLW